MEELLKLVEQAQRQLEDHCTSPDDDDHEIIGDTLEELRSRLLPLAYPIPEWPPECPLCDKRMHLLHAGPHAAPSPLQDQRPGYLETLWLLVCEPCGIAAPSADATT